MGIMRTLKINGEVFNITPVVPASSVTLLASAWVSGGTSHYQVVELPGVTSHTKVDLQPTPEQLEEFHTLTLAFVAENENGVVTVYAIGDKPTGDHTIQTTLTEVEREGKIRGNTVGTTMPRTDFTQTDPTQADYLKGREKIVQSVNGVAPDENGNVTVTTGGMVDEAAIEQAVSEYMTDNPVVKTVNGQAPDENGNVEVEGGSGGSVSDEQVAQAVSDYMAENPVEVPEVDLTGYVKTVNGNAPDENGNVTVEVGGATVTDEHINSLIDAKLGVIENGSY